LLTPPKHICPPSQARRARRLGEAAAVFGPLPADLVALVFERLPPAERCLTVSRLARAWRRWAAEHVEPLATLLSQGLPSWRRHARRRVLQLPLWSVAEAWPQLSAAQRSEAGLRAAACGDVERLRWLRAQDPPLASNPQTCSVAASGGHLDVLRWLRAQDPPCPWDEDTCSAAAGGGHLDVLWWLQAQDPPCPWSTWTCRSAAEGGHLDVLRWLRAQDPPCPWSQWSCSAAAGGGHLDVLRWLRAQDPPCPLSEHSCCEAARSGHLEVLRWLRAQDPPCQWHKATCLAMASAYGQAHVTAWIDTQASAAWWWCCSARPPWLSLNCLQPAARVTFLLDPI
jgi:hypothetical protein